MECNLLVPSVFAPAPDVYAVVRCESDAVRTRVFKEDGNPEFNLRTIFYRRYPKTHISVEVGPLSCSLVYTRKDEGLASL